MGELSEPEEEIDLVGASDLVGTSSASAETETTVGESEDNVGASSASAETETSKSELSEPEETRMGELSEPETEYAEEPEEDEIETETRMGELSEPEDSIGASDDSVGASSASAEEETTVGESDLVGESDPVGASSASAETETELTESEEGSHSSHVQGEKEPEETTVGESEEIVGESDLVGASSASAEEEATVGAKLGELEEIEANTEDKLFGYQGPIDNIEIIQQTTKTYHVGDTYDPSDLKIKAYYDDADTEDEAIVEVAYTGNESKFSFDPDCINNPFTAEEDPYELEINYTDEHGGKASAFIYFQVYPAPASTTYTVTYNQNLPSGYILSAGKTWYADATSDDLENDYIELEGNADMTCDDADSNTRVLQKWNTKADGTGTDYNFGDKIEDAIHFTEYKLILYAVWEPVVPGPTAYVYYMKYNDTTKKYEDKYATIESGKTDEELNTFINGLWDTTFEKRLVSWFVMSPTDPSKEDLASYDHFSNKFDYEGTKEHFKVAYNNWNNGTPTENLHLGAGFSKCVFNLFYRVKYGSYDPEKTYGFGPEGQTDEQFEEFFKPIIDEAMIKDGVKGLYKLNPANPMNPTLDDYNEYYTGASVYEATLTGLKQAYDAWNDNPTESISFGVIYTDPSAPTTYTVTYNQNLPSGYSLSDGKTWYTDSTSTDLSGSPIVLSGSSDMTCEDTSGNTRTLLGWNTYSSGAGSSYDFGDFINTDTGFAGDTLTLYAMWSDPVAPTTGFMYWKVDGDDNNKTIHYYATPGEGRAAVVIGTNGVEHTSLGSSDREKIKYAVFEDNIAATNLECCFKNFKGLESITDLGKLDTSNVTSMREMFNTTGVKELDLTNFDTSNVTDMYGMFSSCGNLETIRVSDKFVVDKVSTSNGKFMFANCNKLVGEKGTKIADLSSPYGVAYAHIDEGSTNPGLFSGASAPTTTYTVKYNQDLPTGYTLSGGMTWYTDSTTTDLTGSPIILKGSADMTCEDTSGNTRTLQAWNTQIELKGNTFNFGDTFNDPQYFDPDPTCPLYAVWSDPVGPTPTTYTIKYDKNLPSGYTISTSKTWYTDSTSDDLSSNPIKISGSAGMTCENADGYVRKLEAWNTLADKSGTPYMFAENISSPAAFTSNPLTLYAVWGDPVVPTPGTDKFYIISYGNPTEYPNEKKIFAFDSTTTVEEMENFVANNISKCINPSGKAANGFYDMSELIPVGADDTQVRQILNDNYDLTKEKIRTLDKIAVWFEDYIPDPMGVYLGITFEGSTPAKTVTKIAIKTNPTKTTYDSGDAFDPTGLVITVAYSDGSTEDVDYATHQSDFSFNPTTITASGDVVVTYGGKTANISVTVAEVGDIYILEAPDKTVYRAGQYFDPTGLVIQVVGDAEPIAYDKNKDLFTFEPSLTTALTTANKSVKVMFDGKSTTQAITVTNPTPTPTPPGGGGTGGSSSGDSNPEKGPMGDLTKNPMYQQQLQNQQLNTTNNIPQTSLLTDTTLISTLQSYSQNQYMLKTNARDQYGNTGFGQWQHVPGTQTWYFLSGDLNSNGTTGTVGLLTNGWYNLGWDGQDKWYHFDANGVMGLGWYQEGGKTYYLETNPYDNWYGKAVTGQQIIDGQVYNFDASGALIA